MTDHRHIADTPSPGTRSRRSTSSGARTPTHSSHNASMSNSMISSMWSGFMRHFSATDMTADSHDSRDSIPRLVHASTEPCPANDGVNDVFVPPHMNRTASPFRPPPLDPIVLHGYRQSTPHSARLLSTSISEEIRIMLPERLRILEDWRLIYSLDQDGASLATLYQRAAAVYGRRVGFVLVVRDEAGGTFGAYLSEYPRPAPTYFGNGECFLWRASLLAGLPPPPSDDTSTLTSSRTTTIASGRVAREPPDLLTGGDQATTTADEKNNTQTPAGAKPYLSPSESIRFKAFPYSGINDYYINCETGFLSMGAGDGHYGLWLDDSLGRGRSGRSQTFGNEPLSDEGEKFAVLGVELWMLGS